MIEFPCKENAISYLEVYVYMHSYDTSEMWTPYQAWAKVFTLSDVHISEVFP